MSQPILRIDLDAITQNWSALDALSAPHVQTGAVVKAGAYGLGIKPVAQKLFQKGARHFFVATMQEAVQLRPLIDTCAKLYVFSGYMAGEQDMLSQHDIIPLLNSPSQIKRFQNDFSGRAYGLQLDTGMNRLGLEPDEFAQHKNIAPDSALIISHLACSDTFNHPMNAQQLAAFKGMTDGLDVPCSLAATGGILLDEAYHFDLVRPGIGLYGGLPFVDAHPVATLDVPIIQTRRVMRGETVGYGNKWQAARDSVVATLAAGYADGIIRAIGNGEIAFYAHNDISCPLIGRISMDLITIDVTGLNSLPSHLSVLNKRQGIDDLADAAGTIGYEVLTSLGQRYARRY